MKVTASILLVIFFGSSLVYGQKFNIQEYTVNDGLPISDVREVFSDSHGYLWFATSTGIVRYNGKNYVTYTQEDGLRGDLGYLIFEDSEGNIWASTEFGGMAHFENNRFVYPEELQMVDTTVVNYVLELDNEFWIATETMGVVVWNRDKNTFRVINMDDGLPNNHVWDLYQSGGDLWIATGNGSVKYSGDSITETFIQKNGEEIQSVYQITSDREGNIWMATDVGVVIIRDKGELEIIREIQGIDLGVVYSIAKDAAGRVWIGTSRRGLFIYDDGDFEYFNKSNGLTSNFIYWLRLDRAGFMWVTTESSGVLAFRDMNLNSYDSDSELGENQIFSLLITRNGTLWAGTDKGIHSLKEGVFGHYQIPQELLIEDEIWEIQERPNGNLLLLTYYQGILEFDGSNFFRSPLNEFISDDYIHDFFVDSDGSVWLSTFGNLHHIINGTVTIYPTPTDFWWKQFINVIYRDGSGLLWIGTEAGIALFTDSTYTYYDSGQGLVGDKVYQITEDEEGSLWVGTNKGISFVSRSAIQNSEIQFNDFYSRDLTNEETIILQFDQFGGLWQGTNSGLSYLDVQKSRASNKLYQSYFPFSQTEKGIELNGSAVVVDSTGTVWFGSNSRGLISYNFKGEQQKIHFCEAPKVYLREIRADDEPIFLQSNEVEMTPYRSIAHNENDLVFRFNAIDYLNPHNIKVKYRLKGYDDEWQEGDDISLIRYTNVPPGEYTLEIITKSNKSMESDVVELATIRVKKPFFTTAPFFLILLGAIFWLIRMYVNYSVAQIEQQKLQKLVDIQTKELTRALTEKEVLIKEIHHRVKNNLAVVSGLMELQSYRMSSGEALEAITESKMRVIAIAKIHENLYQNHDLSNVDFGKFIGELIKSIEAALGSSEQTITVVQKIDEVFLDVNIGVPLGLLINELVSNCFKHAFPDSKEGTINITFIEQKYSYELTVADNGRGADEDILTKATQSLGMTLITSLIEQISASISYQKKDGSVFSISIPKVDV